MKKGKILIYKEYFNKYLGKITAQEILFGWFDYCELHGIKNTHDANEEIEKLNKQNEKTI